MADIDIKVRLQAEKAQAQLAKLTAQTRRAEAQTAKYQAQVKKAELGVKKASLQNQLLAKRLTNVSKAARRGASAFGVFAANVAAIGFSKLVSGVGSFVATAFKASQEIETLSVQFEVLTGSAEKSRDAMANLREFAAGTPFQIKDLGKAQQRLLAFGIGLEQSQKDLRVLGDVAAASGSDIGEIAQIFGKVSAQGKVTGRTLLQLQKRAIPIGPEIAKTMGVAESAITDLVKEGKVSFDVLQKSFQSLTGEGGKFFNALEKRSKTVQGRISTLKDNFELFSASIAERFGPAIKAAISTLTLFIQKIGSSSQFNNFLDFLSSKVPTAVSFVLDGFGTFIDVVANVAKAFKVLQTVASVVIGSIGKAVGGVINTLGSLASGFGLFDNKVSKGLKNAGSAVNSLGDSFIQNGVKIANSIEGISNTQEMLSGVIQKGKNFLLNTLAEETKAAQEQATIMDAVADQRVGSNDKIDASNEKRKIKNKNTLDQELADVKALFEARRELEIAQEEQDILKRENETVFRDERLLAIQDAFSFEEQAAIQSKLNLLQNEVDKETLITQTLTSGLQKRYDLRLKAKQNEEKLEKQKNQVILSGSQGLFGALAAVAKAGGEKNFGIYKALATAEVVLATISAVQKAAASAPFPANVPAIAAETIRGGVNIAKINSTTPKFENGGIVPGGSFSGDRVVARVNSGEMILNRQQQTNLFKGINNGSMGGGQPIQVTTNVQVDGETIARAVSNQVANGFEIGEVN